MAHNYSVAGHVHMSTSTNLSFVLSFNYIKIGTPRNINALPLKRAGLYLQVTSEFIQGQNY